MKAKGIEEPLRHYLKTYCDVNAVEINELRKQIRNPKIPERANAFRKQLASTIVNKSLNPEEYEALTGEDFDNQEELETWLRELWRLIFDDAPIPNDQR